MSRCACRGECATPHTYRSDDSDRERGRCPQRGGEKVRGRRPVAGDRRIEIVSLDADGYCDLCAYARSRRATELERGVRRIATGQQGLFERSGA